jgi:hypothetical protein
MVSAVAHAYVLNPVYAVVIHNDREMCAAVIIRQVTTLLVCAQGGFAESVHTALFLRVNGSATFRVLPVPSVNCISKESIERQVWSQQSNNSGS